MPRKPVRGRFSMTVPLDGGGSWSCVSCKEKFLTPTEIVAALREYANFIEEFLIESATTADAVDPHLESEGKPTTRA